MELDLHDRFRGSLVGLAVCDAIGTTVEFRARGSFKPLTDMVGGGPFRLKPGEWTDDTSMALCLAASLLETRSFNPSDQLLRYCRWAETGYMSSTGECFDIGSTTSGALHRFRRDGSVLANHASTSEANGSIMRLAPIPIAFSGDPKLAVHLSGESSRTTHGSEVCVDCCRLLGAIIVRSLAGTPKEQLLSFDQGIFGETPLCAKVAGVLSSPDKNPQEIRGTGHALRCLEAAIWAFFRTETFKDGALAAVNLGDDADTTGAVYGQIAGAYYGASSIPSHWLALLAKQDLITDLVEGLWGVRDELVASMR